MNFYSQWVTIVIRFRDFGTTIFRALLLFLLCDFYFKKNGLCLCNLGRYAQFLGIGLCHNLFGVIFSLFFVVAVRVHVRMGHRKKKSDKTKQREAGGKKGSSIGT